MNCNNHKIIKYYDSQKQVIMEIHHNNKSDDSRFRVQGYPVRHKEKIPFEPRLGMDLHTRHLISEIRSMDETLGRFILSERDYLDLANEAYASNIHWSTKIEGNRMTYEEVKALTTKFSSGKTIEHPNGPMQEILNHLSSLLSLNVFTLPWDVNTVMRTHSFLMNGVSDIRIGTIRTEDVSVRGIDGTEFFIACPHSHVEHELINLIEWVNNSPYGEIVTATLFFHEFESIHPFLDGNGRTGRVLFQALLQELGLKNCNLCRFEERLLGDTRTYYDLLAYTDLTMDYTILVRYVTESLHEAYSEAVSIFSEKDLLKNMDENTRVLAMMAKKERRFNLKTASGWIPLGSSTVRVRLDHLVELGILGKEGNTKAMQYVFLDPFRDLMVDIEQSLE